MIMPKIYIQMKWQCHIEVWNDNLLFKYLKWYLSSFNTPRFTCFLFFHFIIHEHRITSVSRPSLYISPIPCKNREWMKPPHILNLLSNSNVLHLRIDIRHFLFLLTTILLIIFFTWEVITDCGNCLINLK